MAAADLNPRRAMSLEDVLGAWHRLEGLEFSLDGQRILYQYNGGLWITDRQGDAERLTEGRTPHWSPVSREFAFLRGDPPQIWTRDADGSEQQRTSFSRGISDYTWFPDGRRFAVIRPGGEVAVQAGEKPRVETIIELSSAPVAPGDALWIVTIASGEAHPVAAAPGGVNWFGPAVHPHGTAVALWEEGYRDEAEHVAIIDCATGTLDRPVQSRIRPCKGPRWSPDGGRLAFLYSPHDYIYPVQMQCAVAPRTAGEPAGKVVSHGEGYFIAEGEQLCWAPDGQTIYAIGIRGSTRQVLRIDLRGGEVRQLTHAAGWYTNLRLSPDGEWLACAYTSPTSLGRLCLIPTAGGPLQMVLETDEPLRQFRLASYDLVHWRAGDGMELEGVLIKPLGYQPGRRYPLVVDLHGGPAPGGTALFKPFWHWLAAHGYMVFSPDFRTGQTFRWVEPEAHALDFSDVMAGIDSLIDAGSVDPNRMGFFGHSYGADLGAWMLGHTGRFRAAVVSCGGYDWIVGYGLSGGWTTFSKALAGPPWKAWEAYRRFSPLTYLHRATTPTLLLSGDRDLVHIQMMNTWLRRVGVEVEAIHYRGEGHVISRPEHRRDWQERMLAWFEKHLNGTEEK